MSEEILYESHPSMFRSNPFWFAAAVILIAAYGLGLIILLFWWLQCLGVKLTVTKDRTILRRGILSKHISEVFHSDVRNIQFNQTVAQRICGVGSIGISSAGQTGMEIEIAGIPHPERVKEIIDTYRKPGKE